MKILVVAAHPDDELLGCGGTIKKLAESHETHIAILGEGISSRHGQRSEVDVTAIKKLQADATSVSQLLGAQSVVFANLPDNRFDELPLLDIVKQVERIIQELRPAVIYTHHPGDLNIDHGLTFRAVMTATRPTAGCPVQEIYTFEVASSSEWAFQKIGPAFKPNVFEDVVETIETKIQGMALYESEARSFPHPRSAEALRVQARRWGAVVGLEYAEAFELIRSTRV